MPPSKAPIQEGPADRRQLLLIIKNKYGALSRASKTIADFILAHHDEAIYLNIRQIAAHCQVSEATVTNFVKAIGLRSFQEFKICMARGAQEEPEVKRHLWADPPERPQQTCSAKKCSIPTSTR